MSVAAMLAAAVFPIVPLASEAVSAAALPRGASAFTAVTPARLADTRVPNAAEFTRLNPATIRVKVAGRAGIPDNATAAVLNITSVNARAAAFVTAFPAGNVLPNASSLNVDRAGRIIGNLATVQLGTDGAVDLYTNQPMDLVIDVAGAYVPVASEVAAGRLVTVAGGARRVLDTREAGGPLGPNSSRVVPLNVNGLTIPADATGVVVNIAATEGADGFWTGYPLGVDRPLASSLYIDQVGQTRNSQGIIALSPGERAFNVYSLKGGHLIVDVVGYFTGASAGAGSDGLFVPNSPLRMRDTRDDYPLAPFNGTTIEFKSGAEFNNLGGQVGAVAMNIAIAEPLNVGFLTAYPAGSSRPQAANLNVSELNQIISNHAIVRIGGRGVALYTQSGTHMIVDVTGWYLGTPDPTTQPPPANPSTAKTYATHVTVETGSISTGISYGTNVDAVVNAGRAVLYGGGGDLGAPDHNIFFAHRTSAGGPFYYMDRIALGDIMTIRGADGRNFKYMVVNKAIISPSPTELVNHVLDVGAPATVTIVACHPLHSTRQRILVTGRLIGVG